MTLSGRCNDRSARAFLRGSIGVRRSLGGRHRLRYPVSLRRTSEGPGKFLIRTPGLQRSARIKALSLGLYARAARRCPVQRRAGVLNNPQTYRLYQCDRCHAAVQICRHCDHGNRYCAGACAGVRRRESLRRAAHRYQSSRRGAHRHAARQSAWRARQQQKVTHHGSLPVAPAATVAVTFTAVTSPRDHAQLHAPARHHPDPHAHLRCSFCHCVLPPFARLWHLRGGP